MRMLIIYGTVEGQTRKIAKHLGDTLKSDGHSVETIDATDGGEVPGTDTFDAVIVAAPVHAGSYPAPLRRMVRENVQKLMARPGALISVSLSAASQDEDEMDELHGIVEAFGKETGWWPVSVHHAAGALKYTEYDFFRRWVLKRIQAKEGGPTDTSRDYEFTDWAALDAFAAEFARQAPEVAGKI